MLTVEPNTLTRADLTRRALTTDAGNLRPGVTAVEFQSAYSRAVEADREHGVDPTLTGEPKPADA